MPVAILMPALSPTMKKGNLSKWIKKEGDTIKSGDIIAEIETDKATMEVETVEDGIIGKILIPEGSSDISVNTAIAVVLNKKDSPEQLETFIKTLLPLASTKPTTINTPSSQPKEYDVKTMTSASITTLPSSTDHRIKATPLARRIAHLNNIDLKTIQGSGPYGRIIEADVKQFSSTGSTSGHEVISMTPMRKVIADRLTMSKQTIPHFYLAIDIKTEQLLSLRKSINDKMPDSKITINDLIVKATAITLMNVPALNATFHEDHIKRFKCADISIAISIEGGLITPILQAADQKSISVISREIKNLSIRAKEHRLKTEEFVGGSFTISNLGMFGIKHFEAIINPPQVGILAVGGIQDNGMMTLTLSCDHRAVDGTDGALFLSKLKQYLENPYLMLI